MPVVVIDAHGRAPAETSVAPPEVGAVLDASAGRVPVLLVAGSPEAERVARSVRFATGGADVGVLRVDVPPTLAFVTAAVLRGLPEALLGLAGFAAEAVRSVTRTQALLSSVASLETPAPRLGQHLASLWPTTRFLVDRSEGSVVRARSLAAPDAGVVALTARSSNAWPDVTTEGWAVPVVDLGPQPDDPWRCRRWVETTVLTVSPEDVLAHVAQVAEEGRLPRCPSCARQGWDGPCLFCGIPLGAADEDPPLADPFVAAGGHQ